MTFLSEVEGGRSTPCDLSRYRTIASPGRHDQFDRAGFYFGVQFSGPVVEPGSSATATMRALAQPDGMRAVELEQSFTLFEPPRVVAHGLVVEVA